MRASGVSDVSTGLGGINGTAEDLSGQAFAFQEKRLHDANGRLQKTFVQNSGNNADAGLVSAFLETENVYDILGDVRQVKSEVGTLGETSTWQYSYDANQNLIEVTQPMGNVTRHTAGTREGFPDRRGHAGWVGLPRWGITARSAWSG
jgi:YD repeat-containing protein